LVNGKKQVDQGFGKEIPVIQDALKCKHDGEPPPVIGKNSASRQAISDIFRWASSQMEVSGKKIYSHPWVITYPSIDQGLEDVPEKSGSAERRQNRQRTEEWLDALPDFKDCPECDTFGQVML
jgi:hypothetical protein